MNKIDQLFKVAIFILIIIFLLTPWEIFLYCLFTYLLTWVIVNFYKNET